MPKKTKPAAIAEMEAPSQPYSACVQIGNHFHFSGVVAIDGDMKPDGDLGQQISRVFTKIGGLLINADLCPDDVYSATILLSGDMSGYDIVNEAWTEFFEMAQIKPRRKAFAVAALPFGCAVEIEFDAVKQSE